VRDFVPSLIVLAVGLVSLWLPAGRAPAPTWLVAMGFGVLAMQSALLARRVGSERRPSERPQRELDREPTPTRERAQEAAPPVEERGDAEPDLDNEAVPDEEDDTRLLDAFGLRIDEPER